VRQGNKTFYANLRDDVAQALEEYRQLVTVIDTKCAEAGRGRFESLPSSALVKRLTEAVDQVKLLTADLFPDAPESASSAEEQTTAEAAAAGETAAPRVASGAIRNREDAFRELGKVAEYFRRNEPHSPVSFALEQVIRWGRMSLPELMQELIPNEDARHDMFRLTGIAEDKS
jgi:type VI secretion system protein ImpA